MIQSKILSPRSRYENHSRISHVDKNFSVSNLNKVSPRKSEINIISPNRKQWTISTAKRLHLSSDANISILTQTEMAFQRATNPSALNGGLKKKPDLRDGCLFNASRDKMKKDISFIKLHYDFDRHARQSEEIGIRHHLVAELKSKYPMIEISYD